ncbi:MAG: ATP-binding protein [Actinomycetota bacterium]|nr:ATP-binding protein [Actinomycetota bacterium]
MIETVGLDLVNRVSKAQMFNVTEILSLDVPCDQHAPAAVRDALGEIHNGAWSLDDGLLVASELVTNAVRHSGCAPDHVLQVSVDLARGGLVISVHDPGISKCSAVPRAGDDEEPGGWGLRIVEKLATRWGAERPNGYRVWAELPVMA